jgi:hypothetical protein
MPCAYHAGTHLAHSHLSNTLSGTEIGNDGLSLVQRDYLLRLFEQMTQAITIMIGLREAGQPQDALKLMSESLLGLVGFDLNDIERIPAADLVGMVRLARSGHASPGEMVAGQLAVIAIVLKEAADVYDVLNDGDRRDVARLKALHLNLAVVTEERVDIEQAHDAIPVLVEQLEEYVLPYDVTEMLWSYHEQTGDYARAENRLYELLELHEPDESILSEGIAFYERLQILADTELARGGLPRDEVEAGLREFKAM